MPKLRGGIGDPQIKPPGLGPAAHAVLLPFYLGYPAVSHSSTIYSSNSGLLSATSIASTTFAAGSQPVFCRNLVYQLSISGNATGMVSAGTLSVQGWDMASNTISESVALTAVAAASTDLVQGTKCFQSISGSGFTVSGYLLATASSTRSKSISLYVGAGNKLGLPNSVQSTNAVPMVWLGSANQTGSYTVVAGNVGDAGISLSNALSAGSAGNVLVYQWLNR